MIMFLIVIILMIASAAAGAYGYAMLLESDFGSSSVRVDPEIQARLDALEVGQRLSMTAWQTERQMYESALYGKKSKS